jgi:hypothetical protein
MPLARFLVSKNSFIGSSNEAHRHRFYLRVCLGVIALGLVLLALFNLLVDPLGAYRFSALGLFQPYRGHFTSRAGKSEAVAHGNYDLILLGTSRVELGMPIDHPAYQSDRVYNLGLEGTSLPELAAALDLALKNNPLKRVIFGVDFLLFSDRRATRADFENSRFNPRLNIFEYHARNLFDWDATVRSWSLVERLEHHKAPPAAERGFVPRTIPPKLSQRTVFARRIHDFLVNPETYGAYRYSPERVRQLHEMIRQCRARGVDLVIFIPPVHALQLETIRIAGLWPVFEQWKRDAVQAVAEETASQPIPLWDFSGFKDRVAENVPAEGDKTTRMKWYIDSSHFTPALGSLVLDRLFSPMPGEGNTDDFGVPLVPGNVEPHLARLRVDRESYAGAHSDELQWLKQLALRKKEKMKRPNAPGE